MEKLFLKAYEAAIKGQSYAFATIIESTLKGTPRKTGAKMVVLADGSCFGSIGGGRTEKLTQGACLKAIKNRRPETLCFKLHEGSGPGHSICGGELKVFIEPFSGKRHLIICGAGHISLPLSAMGKMLNYRVTVLDNRPELANRDRFPHVDDIRLGHHSQELKKLRITQNSHIIIVTQGHECDFGCLQVALKTKAAYVGLISSSTKKIKFIRKLRALKFPEQQIRKMKAPMGIDIGAQTPEEIAISILAELIGLKNRNYLDSTKFKSKYGLKGTSHGQ